MLPQLSMDLWGIKPCFQDHLTSGHTRNASNTICPSSKLNAKLTSKNMAVCSFNSRKTMVVCCLMDGYHPRPFTLSKVQGHLLLVNQNPPLVTPSYKYEVKPKRPKKPQEIDTMVCKRIIQLGQGNKGFFTYSFVILKKKWTSHFIMNLKPVHYL